MAYHYVSSRPGVFGKANCYVSFDAEGTHDDTTATITLTNVFISAESIAPSDSVGAADFLLWTFGGNIPSGGTSGRHDLPYFPNNDPNNVLVEFEGVNGTAIGTPYVVSTYKKGDTITFTTPYVGDETIVINMFQGGWITGEPVWGKDAIPIYLAEIITDYRPWSRLISGTEYSLNRTDGMLSRVQNGAEVELRTTEGGTPGGDPPSRVQDGHELNGYLIGAEG